VKLAKMAAQSGSPVAHAAPLGAGVAAGFGPTATLR
jgi:hypothetical protein